MTYDEAVEIIYSKSWGNSKVGLERMYKFCELAGNPQNKLKFVHIAGTNGKGSTATMIMEILVKAGYKVGLFTSPSLVKLNERILINGIQISDREFTAITQHLKKYAINMEETPTEFEWITAIAFEYFSRNHCDLVILEVGMGGRLDSTNVIEKAEVAVITSIGYDHMKELGNTLPKIAKEKAGIIKSGSDVVFYNQELSVKDTIENVCIAKNSQLHIVNFDINSIKRIGLIGQKFSTPMYPDIFIPLLGEHQQKNACVAIQTIQILREKGWTVDDRDIYDGLAESKCMARFEIFSENPIVILDGGHNAQAIEAMGYNLKDYFPQKNIVFVIGVLLDKDYRNMMDILIPIAKQIYTVTADNPRALPASELAEYIKTYGLPVMVCDKPIDGVEKALQNAGEDTVLCILGSLAIAGSVRSYLQQFQFNSIK